MINRILHYAEPIGVESAMKHEQKQLAYRDTLMNDVRCQKIKFCKRMNAMQELVMYHIETIDLHDNPQGQIFKVIDDLFPKANLQSKVFNLSLKKKVPERINEIRLKEILLLIKEQYSTYIKSHLEVDNGHTISEEEAYRFFSQEIPNALLAAQNYQKRLENLLTDMEIERIADQRAIERCRDIMRAVNRV